MTASSHPPVFSKSLALAAIVLLALNLRSPITSVGPVLDQIIHSFHLSAVAAGWLNALPLLAFGALAPVAPIVARRLGLESALFIAVMLVTCGTLVRSLGHEGELWSGTLLMSAGIALVNVLLPALVKRDFSDNPSGVIGLYATTMAITASLASGVSAPLSLLSGSWQLAIGIWALPALLAAVLWGRRASLQRRARQALPAAAPVLRKNPWRSALGWQVSLFMALQSLSFYTLIGWFTPYVMSLGYSASAAGGMLFCYQIVAVAANMLGVSVLKRAADQRLLAFVATLAIFTGIAGLLLLPGLALLWMIVTGFGSGTSMLICLSLFGLRTHDAQQASVLSGMAQCVGYIAASVGPLLFGVLHDGFGGWQPALVVLLLTVLLQMFFATLAGRNLKIG